MRTIEVRLQRLYLYDGPIAVRLVDRANNSHHDPGSVTDGALAERLASYELSGRSEGAIRRKLSRNPAEATFREEWPTFGQAIDHWVGEGSRSPVKRVTWTCLNVFCGFGNRSQIGARCRETTSLKCQQCGRTQRVGLSKRGLP